MIYTCREDWLENQPLKDKHGDVVDELFDDVGNKVGINKEGIHFDLEHRNRIKWSQSDLPKFKNDLEKRIKAVIV